MPMMKKIIRIVGRKECCFLKTKTILAFQRRIASVISHFGRAKMFLTFFNEGLAKLKGISFAFIRNNYYR